MFVTCINIINDYFKINFSGAFNFCAIYKIHKCVVFRISIVKGITTFHDDSWLEKYHNLDIKKTTEIKP